MGGSSTSDHDDSTSQRDKRLLRCEISLPPIQLRVALGHSAMSAQCPVCLKADAAASAGRSNRARNPPPPGTLRGEVSHAFALPHAPAVSTGAAIGISPRTKKNF